VSSWPPTISFTVYFLDYGKLIAYPISAINSNSLFLMKLVAYLTSISSMDSTFAIGYSVSFTSIYIRILPFHMLAYSGLLFASLFAWESLIFIGEP
jgi:hypothetical protein